MTSRVDEVQRQVEEMLAASGYPFKVEKGRAQVERGSAAVFIRAREWHNGQDTIVELLVPVLQGVPESAGLLRRLNEQNRDLYFGKAYWQPTERDGGEVWLAHNLLGDDLRHEALIAAVGMLAVVADRLDDELKKEFGGRRWKEQ